MDNKGGPVIQKGVNLPSNHNHAESINQGIMILLSILKITRKTSQPFMRLVLTIFVITFQHTKLIVSPFSAMLDLLRIQNALT